MKEFNFLCGTKIRFSTDFSTAIKACRDEIECTKAFIVTDPILYELPIYQEFLTAIKQAGLKYEEYHNVRVNPTDVVIMDCASALRKSDCDIVISFGGGSAIDTAKGAAVLHTNPGDISDYYGVDQVKRPSTPIIAVPTTAGSGAEVSNFIALTKAAEHAKAQVASVYCCPGYAILSPGFMKGLPAHTAASCGLDALAHAVESYISRKANVITQALALQSFGLIFRNLYAFVQNREDEEAAASVLLGSCLSVMSAGRVGTCDGHCLARALQGALDMSHGDAIAMALPHALAVHVESAAEKLSKCASEMGIDTVGMTQVEAAKACVKAIEKLRDDLNLVRSPEALGVEVSDEKIEDMAKNAVFFSENGSEKDSSPRKLSVDDYKRLLCQIKQGAAVVF